MMNAPTLIAGVSVGTASAVALFAQDAAVAAGVSRSTAEILQIIAAVTAATVTISGVLIAGAVQIVTLRMNKAVSAVAAVVAPIAQAVADIGVQGDAIKHSVDGTATKMAALVESLQAENKQLRADKVDQKEIIIAQATAAPVTGTGPTGAGPAESLVNIDATTKGIEKNTAKTEAIVKKLKKDQT